MKLIRDVLGGLTTVDYLMTCKEVRKCLHGRKSNSQRGASITTPFEIAQHDSEGYIESSPEEILFEEKGVEI